MSDKKPKGIFQDRYNKPDSAIPPDCERLLYIVFKGFQQSFEKGQNRWCVENA